MGIAETIKSTRESRNMTQEELAERLEVSRQAVSKWELGASVPTPENPKLLEEILEVTFEVEEGAAPARLQGRNLWKTVAATLGGLMLAALVSIGLYSAMSGQSPAAPGPIEPAITGVYFFGEDGAPLTPDLGDGWKRFTVGQRACLLVGFQQNAEADVYGAALYATPTGTETYDQRKQLAVQAAGGRPFALFPLDFPEETMVHLDVTLECSGGQTVTETLNVTAVPVSEVGSKIYEFQSFTEAPADGPVAGEIRFSPSTFPTGKWQAH